MMEMISFLTVYDPDRTINYTMVCIQDLHKILDKKFPDE